MVAAGKLLLLAIVSPLFFLMNSRNIDNVRAKHKINHSRFSLLFSISRLFSRFSSHIYLHAGRRTPNGNENENENEVDSGGGGGSDARH